jgi:hypothetical protein
MWVFYNRKAFECLISLIHVKKCPNHLKQPGTCTYCTISKCNEKAALPLSSLESRTGILKTFEEPWNRFRQSM